MLAIEYNIETAITVHVYNTAYIYTKGITMLMIELLSIESE